MRAQRQVQLTGVMGVCLLSVPVLRQAWNRPPVVARSEGRPPPRPRQDPAEETLWQARRWRARAVIAVNRERDMLEAWDPAGLEGINAEAWRVQWMAADPTGDCGHAMALAKQAALCARNSDEEYHAVELLVLLDAERGDHQAALQEAQRLVRLRPQSDCARMVFRLARERAAGGRVCRPCRPDSHPTANRRT